MSVCLFSLFNLSFGSTHLAVDIIPLQCDLKETIEEEENVSNLKFKSTIQNDEVNVLNSLCIWLPHTFPPSAPPGCTDRSRGCCPPSPCNWTDRSSAAKTPEKKKQGELLILSVTLQSSASITGKKWCESRRPLIFNSSFLLNLSKKVQF